MVEKRWSAFGGEDVDATGKRVVEALIHIPLASRQLLVQQGARRVMRHTHRTAEGDGGLSAIGKGRGAGGKLPVQGGHSVIRR